MWAFRDGHLERPVRPGRGLRGKRGAAAIVRVQLDDAGTERCLSALEPITRTARTRARARARSGTCLLALDIVATAARCRRRGRRGAAAPAAVATALALIEDDVAFPWTLAELSPQTYVGPTHLARTFAQVARAAADALSLAASARNGRQSCSTRTDDPVASIGAAVGWPDPAYFSRRFRPSFGMSPREYRHRQRLAASAPGSAPPVLRA